MDKTMQFSSKIIPKMGSVRLLPGNSSIFGVFKFETHHATCSVQHVNHIHGTYIGTVSHSTSDMSCHAGSSPWAEEFRQRGLDLEI